MNKYQFLLCKKIIKNDCIYLFLQENMFETDEGTERFFDIFQKTIDNVNWDNIHVPLNLPLLEYKQRQQRELYAERKYMETLFRKL